MSDPIHALLKSPDRAQVLTGVEQALAAGDAYVDKLLSGVSVQSWSQRGVHELTFPRGWNAPDDRFSVQQEGFLRIVGRSQSTRAKALRGKLGTIQLLATDRRWTWGTVKRRPVHVDQLADLAVKHLEILNARDVVSTRPLPSVRHLELHDTHLDALPDCPELRVLEVHQGELGALDLSAFPKLEQLVLHGVGKLSDVAGARGLPLTRVALTGLARLPDLSGISSLEILHLDIPKGQSVRFESERLTQVGLTFQTADAIPPLVCKKLSSLTLSGSGAVDLSLLSGVAQLDELSLFDMPKLASLDGLPAVRTLHLRNLAKLKRVVGSPRLTRLTIQTAERLLDLDGLGACPELKRVDIWSCQKLASIGGLKDSPKLETIQASHCLALKSVDGLAACTQLRDLQFIGCRGSGLDLMPLDGLTNVKRIRCTRTSIGKTRIPESLHPVVVPKSLVKRRSRAGSDKPLPKQARGVARKQVAKLKKLMFSRDLDRMDQCAELVGALGSDEVAIALGGGSKLGRDAPAKALMPRSQSGLPSIFHGPYDQLVPNRYFECGDILMPFRGHGLRALAARVPDESELAELRQATGLVLVGRSKRWEKAPVRVWPLGAFEELERVGIFCASEVEDAELLGDCEKLSELALYDVDKVETLGAFCEAETLRTLRVERLSGDWSLGQEDGLGRLEELEIVAWWRSSFQPDGRDLRALGSIRELKLGGVAVSEDAFSVLARLPRLEALSLTGHRETSMQHVAGLGRLRSLAVDSTSCERLTELTGLEGLESLEIFGFHSQGLRSVSRLPIRRLHVRHCSRLTGWSQLKGVEELVLEGYPWRKVAELDGLGWPDLKTVKVIGKRLPATVVNRLTSAGVVVT